MGFQLDLALILGRLIGLLLGFTLHEWAHAHTAYRIGGFRALPDPRRLSLDPRVHYDPIGTTLALIAGFGWAKPVPVNPRAFYPRELRGMMLVAISGPLMNLMLAYIVAFVVRLMDVGGLLEVGGFLRSGDAVMRGVNPVATFTLEVLTTLIFFNLFLFVFNLIPLAPLDGWKVMLALLPPDRAYRVAQYEQQSTYVLLFLFVLSILPGGGIIGMVLAPLVNGLFEFMVGFPFYIW